MSSGFDEGINEGIALIVTAAGIALLFVSVFFAIPVIAAGFGGWCYYRWQFKSPAALERQAKEHTRELYQAAINQNRNVPDKIDWGKGIYRAMPSNIPEDLADLMLESALTLYDVENFDVEIPPPPTVCNSIEGARYRDFLSGLSSKLSSPASALKAQEIVGESYADFPYLLPDIEDDDASPFRMPLENFFGDKLGEAIEALVLPYFREETQQLGLFKELKEQLMRNMHELSDIPYTPDNYNHPDLILPTDYDGQNFAEEYLKYTPFLDYFKQQVPVKFDPKTRFEHQWILAGTGHGKTQTLQYLLAHDFEKVANNEASVVVIDSQNKLLNTISHLKMFAPGEPLDGKLVWIDPGDVEFPLCLNLFNVHLERLENYSMRDRERLLNNLIELYDFVLRSLIDSPLTSRQSTLFQFLVRLMLQIPDATIHTFIDLLKPNSFKEFEPYIRKLDRTAQTFFETDFRDGKYNDTMSQIRGRLFSILKSQTFDRMFSNTENKVDLFEELKTAKVVLINTDKDLLKEGGASFFGRFFIAMLRQAAEERSNLSAPLPTYLYFDEAADYFDEQFTILLSQVRKHNIGCVIVNQYMDQASMSLNSALISNTSIKFAGGVSPKDAAKLAPAMETSTDYILSQPKMTFAAYIKGATVGAFPVQIPLLHMENMEKMTKEEHQQLRETMRGRYSRHYLDDEAPDSNLPQSDETVDDPEIVDVKNAEEIKENTSKYSESSNPKTKDTGNDGDPNDPDNPEIKPSDTW